MTLRFLWASHAFHIAIVRGASLMVPARARAEWLREWLSELWHVRRACSSASGQCEVTAFCLGAFQDALCLRRESRRRVTQPLRGSPAHCVLGFAAAALLSAGLSRLLPGVRMQANEGNLGPRPGLILIEDESEGGDSAATIPFAQFRDWKSSRQRYFDDFAFYRMPVKRAAAGEWPVAYASANLFSLLGLPLRFAAPGLEMNDGMAAVVLSCAAFERQFNGSPLIAGTTIRIGGRIARVAGVAPCAAPSLPGHADAWLLMPDADFGAGDKGYAVAHLNAAGRAEMTASRIQIGPAGSAEEDGSLTGVSMEGRIENPRVLYLFAVFLAFLCLPAVTAVTLGEASFSSHKPTWQQTIWRWSFLWAKILLLLPIAYYAPLDIAYSRLDSASSFAAIYLQLVLSFAIGLLGMRWILLDQRRRCPVCLHCVSNPAQVGDASRTFLAWNGTEMICLGGHTMLHVPGLPTSWFSTQRWLYLDHSWEFLFAGHGEA